MSPAAITPPQVSLSCWGFGAGEECDANIALFPSCLRMYLGKKELQLTRSREDSVSSAWAEEMVLPSDNKKQVTCKVSSPGLPAPLAAHAALDLLCE